MRLFARHFVDDLLQLVHKAAEGIAVEEHVRTETCDSEIVLEVTSTRTARQDVAQRLDESCVVGSVLRSRLWWVVEGNHTEQVPGGRAPYLSRKPIAAVELLGRRGSSGACFGAFRMGVGTLMASAFSSGSSWHFSEFF